MDITKIVIIIAAVIVLWIILVFNRLVTLRNRTKEAWSDINVQLKRRYNLIPNLVETVKGYASHERQLFENVTKARTLAMQAQTVKEKGEAENMLSGTLKFLFLDSVSAVDAKPWAHRLPQLLLIFQTRTLQSHLLF